MKSIQTADKSSILEGVEHIHMVGIGGSGMLGIAEILLKQGVEVSGSDLQPSPALCRLKQLGAKVQIGHSGSLYEKAELAVISSAIPESNREFQRIRDSRLPWVLRAQVLAELMHLKCSIALAGTHGKTTTAALTAQLLLDARLDPSWIIGGLVRSNQSHAQLGSSKYMVVEADESDASFLYLNPQIAILTNIDQEHMGTFNNDLRQLEASFVQFLNQLPDSGLAILCGDDPGINRISSEIKVDYQTYGFGQHNDFYASDYSCIPSGCRFRLHRPDRREPLDLQLSLLGKHNVLNALAVSVLADYMQIKDQVLQSALTAFEGVARRCELTPQISFAARKIDLVDDYGHHPSEVAAVIAALREAYPGRRLVVAFQPHRYSRTRDCYQDLVQALSQSDALVLLETYAAGEDPIEGADSQALWEGIEQAGRIKPVLVSNREDAFECLAEVVEEGDLVMIQGAGDIAALAQKIREVG